MPTRHVGEKDAESVCVYVCVCERASERSDERTNEPESEGRSECWGKRRSRKRRSLLSQGKKGRKSLQPVSERLRVPGQSIKNVSRAEIIKMRISGGSRRAGEEVGCAKDEERRRRRKMYDASTRKGDREWVARGRRRVDGCLKYSPVRLEARDGKSLLIRARRPRRMWLRVNMISLLGSSLYISCAHVYTRKVYTIYTTPRLHTCTSHLRVCDRTTRQADRQMDGRTDRRPCTFDVVRTPGGYRRKDAVGGGFRGMKACAPLLPPHVDPR